MVGEIVVEEPSAATYFELGEPKIGVWNASGGGSMVEVAETLKSYADRMIRIDNGSAFLHVVSLVDGKKIKRAILDFFLDAPEATSG